MYARGTPTPSSLPLRVYVLEGKGVKSVNQNIDNLRYADDTTVMAESSRITKEPLDESERAE